MLGAAVFHSAWNFVLKSEPRRLEASLLALGAAALLSAPILIIHPLSEVSARAWALVLLSAAFETAYMITLTAAYEVGDLSLVYPIARGTAPLVVVPLAVLVLGERLSPSGLQGIALVVVGIFATDSGFVRAATKGSARAAVALAALTGTMTAGYVVAGREVSIVVTALAGALLLHERHSSRRIAGAVVIFLGLVVLAFSR